MKKTLLILFTFLYFLSGNAQNELEGEQLSFSDNKYVASSELKGFQSSDQDYIMLQIPFANIRRGIGIPKKRTEFFIHQFDHDLRTLTTTQSDVSRDYTYLGAFDNESEMVSLYIKYVKKSKTYVLCKANTEKTTPNATLQIKELILCKLPMLNPKGIYFSSSEDNTLHSVTFISTNKKNIFLGMHTIMLDNRGEILWESVHNPSFANETFTIEDVETSNQGCITICSHAYFKNKRGNIRDDVNITIFSISQNGLESFNTKFPYGYIKDMTVRTLRNNNLFIAGYYTDDLKRNASKLFSVMLDLENASFSEIQQKDLLPIVASAEEVASNRFKYNFNLNCRGIEQVNNGNIILLGEEVYIEAVTNHKMNMTYYTYYLNDIVFHTFSEDGASIRDNVIEKEQVARQTFYTSDMDGLTVSYQYINSGDDILLIYNDNIENYKSSQKKIKRYTSGMTGKDACIISATIDPDGEYTKKILSEYQETRNAFTRICYIGDRYALLTFIGSKGSFLERFSF